MGLAGYACATCGEPATHMYTRESLRVCACLAHVDWDCPVWLIEPAAERSPDEAGQQGGSG